MRVELHCHSSFSHDSRMSLKTLEQVAQKRGLHVVAITDHGTIAGAIRAQKVWQHVRVIIGEEILTQDGEIIGLFLHQEVPYHLPLQEAIQRIHDQGGLVCAVHPFCRLRSQPITRQALQQYGPTIDFLEIFNARNIFTADNDQAKIYAETHHMQPMVGSDAHTPREVGRAVAQLSSFLDAETFKKAMRTADFEMRRSPLSVHLETKVTKWARQFIDVPAR